MRIRLSILPIFLVFALLLPGVAEADTFYVTSNNTLNNIAQNIPLSVESPKTHHIRFKEYSGIGQFHLSANLTRDTLIFERDSESAAVIEVSGTLFSFQHHAGTIILRGLAFELKGSSAMLIDGFPTGTALERGSNSSLVLADCFVFGATFAKPILTWEARRGDIRKIEMKRNYFVAPLSVSDIEVIRLTGDDISLHNNNIHFPGFIGLVGRKETSLANNTFNRTRVIIDGAETGDFSVTYNLFGFPPVVLGGGDRFPLIFGDFRNFSKQTATGNRRFPEWAGFEYPDSGRFGGSMNGTVPAFNKVEELWNWAETELTLQGHGNGPDKRVPAYNVMPDSTNYVFRVDNDSLVLGFAAAKIPRYLNVEKGFPNFSETSYDKNLRLASKDTGWVIEGSFNISTLTLNPKKQTDDSNTIAVPFEKGVLLSATSTAYHKQTEVDWVSEKMVFRNDSASARFFVPTFRGNTSRGHNIRPITLQLSDTDILSFGRVWEAGQTMVLDDSVRQSELRPEMRNLDGRLAFITSAKIDTTLTMTFGSKPKREALDTNQVFWWIQSHNKLVRATREAESYKSNSPSLRKMRAQLVEILSVPAGGAKLAYSGGEVSASSVAGFQLQLDATVTALPEVFGRPLWPVKLTWKGNQPSDAITVTIKPDQDTSSTVTQFHQPLWVVNNAPVLAEHTIDTAGQFQIKVPMEGGERKLVFAVWNNILQGETVTSRTVDGLVVQGFTSSTSGRLSLTPLSSEILSGLPGAVNTRFLEGRHIETVDLNDIPNYRINIPLNTDVIPDSVTVFALAGTTWQEMQSSEFGFLAPQFYVKLKSNQEKFVVVEKLAPPSTFVKDSVVASKDLLTFSAELTPGATQQPIVGYRIELRANGPNGEAEPRLSPIRDIGTPIELPWDSSHVYAYRIHYFESEERLYGNPGPFIGVEGLNLKAETMLDKAIPPPQFSLGLISFPYGGKLSEIITPHTPKPEGIKDTTTFYTTRTLVSGSGETSQLDKISATQTTVKPSDAFLFVSTREHKFRFNPQSNTPSKFESITRVSESSGWKFIGNPFPFILPLASVKTDHASGMPLFYRLKVDTPNDGIDQPGVYSWSRVEEGDSLKLFEGYVVYQETGEKLEFNPFAHLALGKKSAVTPALRIRVRSQAQETSIRLFTAGGGRWLPGLPALPGSMRMGVGPGGNAMALQVKSLATIRENLTLFSPHSGNVSFAMEDLNSLKGTEGIRHGLVSLQTGKVYTGTDLNHVEVIQGENQFILLGGTTAFLDQETQALVQSLPKSFRVMQNHPNPFRNFTRIAFDFPTGLGMIHSASLSVFNLHGKIIHTQSLPSLNIGRHEIELTNPGWSPGLYFYRLDISTAKGRFSQGRKLTVAP